LRRSRALTRPERREPRYDFRRQGSLSFDCPAEPGCCTRHRLVAIASFMFGAARPIGINSLELDRQAVPLLCGGGCTDQVRVLILDGRLLQKTNVTRDLRSTRRALAPINIIIQEIRAASLIQVKRRLRTVALCFPSCVTVAGTHGGGNGER
jgi:hypothetical protein